MEKETALVCSKDDALMQQLQSALREAGFNPLFERDPAKALRAASEQKPAVILLDQRFDGEETLEWAANLLNLRRNAKIILLMRAQLFELAREALRVGIRDVLVVPLELQRLPELLPALTKPTRVAQHHEGRVFLFCRAKGGVGSTFLAVNTAVVAAASQPGKVLLIDGNLLTADLRAMLDVDGQQRSIVDLLHVLEELTPRHIQDVCVQHESGLQILLAPPDPSLGYALSADQLAKIVRVARASYSAIFIDGPSLLDERSVALLEEATTALLVITPDTPTVWAWRRVANLPGRRHSKMELVINQVTPKAELTFRDLVKLTGLRYMAEIPYDPALVMPLVNTGKSLFHTGNPKLRGRPPALAKELVRLADHLLEG
jgi:pilus assembly protein CpaE